MDELVFLFDVDNTLIDNDAIQHDLSRHLTENFGRPTEERYWAIFEELRSELGYADYLGALQRYRLEDMHDPRLLRISNWLADYDFAQRLYPGAIEAIAHVRRWGRPVVLSDGDVVFQPRKIERAGLWKIFAGDVLIYIHKERELNDVERWYPGRRYVMIDDKLRILTAVKKAWGDRVRTVFPKQGHYANDPKAVAEYPPADVAVERIADLTKLDARDFAPS